MPRNSREQRHGAGQQAERLGRAPAVLVAVHDRVHGQHQRRRHGHRAGHVEPAAARLAAAAGQEPQREQHHGNADRQVDEEDPVPVEDVGEHAAEQDADRAAARGDEAEHAHRLGAVGRLGEEIHHERERHGRGDRAAHALHRTRGDQELLRGRQAAGQRGDGEQRDAGQEQPAVAVQVAEPPAQQQEAAERQQIGVHDPGQRRRREAEVVPDRGQRHVHDRRVEHDHEAAEAEDDECVPAGAAVQGHAENPLEGTVRRVDRPPPRELIGRRANSRGAGRIR